MNSLQKKSDLTLYIISYHQEYIGHRIELFLKLKKYFRKMILVCRYGSANNEENIIIKGYPNPFGLLRIIGLNKLKIKLEKYFYFPTHKILYVWDVKRKLKKRIKNELKRGEKIAIFISVPPHDNSIIGLALKKIFPQIILVIDWRDLWSYDEFYLQKTSALYKNKLLKIEKEVLNNCDLNITTNYKAKEVLNKNYNISSEKIRTINHPFYEKDILIHDEKYSAKKNNEKIKIGFLGYLFKPPKVPGEKIVAAFRELRKKGLNVELNIYGDRTLAAKKSVKNENEPAVVLHKRTSHKKSLMEIAKCDFLLLALSDLPNCKIIMHSKFPHYLLLKKPIIAIVPQNSYIAELVKKTGTGYIVSIGENIVLQLLRIFQHHEKNKNRPTRNENEINKFSWDNISKQWLQIFKE